MFASATADFLVELESIMRLSSLCTRTREILDDNGDAEKAMQ